MPRTLEELDALAMTLIEAAKPFQDRGGEGLSIIIMVSNRTDGYVWKVRGDSDVATVTLEAAAGLLPAEFVRQNLQAEQLAALKIAKA